MATNTDRLRSAGVNVLAVSQAAPSILAMFLRDHPLPFPIVCDPDHTSYKAFGLERTSLASFLQPQVLWGYARLIARGSSIQRPYPGEDIYQLGGDFLLDRSGRVITAYHSRTATDRPSVEHLLSTLPTR